MCLCVDIGRSTPRSLSLSALEYIGDINERRRVLRFFCNDFFLQLSLITMLGVQMPVWFRGVCTSLLLESEGEIVLECSYTAFLMLLKVLI